MVTFRHCYKPADAAANLGSQTHEYCEASAAWLRIGEIAQTIRHPWFLVGPTMRGERPENWPRVRLPMTDPIREPPVGSGGAASRTLLLFETGGELTML
eukprot:4142421-Amphidinium_carterae.1